MGARGRRRWRAVVTSLFAVSDTSAHMRRRSSSTAHAACDRRACCGGVRCCACVCTVQPSLRVQHAPAARTRRSARVPPETASKITQSPEISSKRLSFYINFISFMLLGMSQRERSVLPLSHLEKVFLELLAVLRGQALFPRPWLRVVEHDRLIVTSSGASTARARCCRHGARRERACLVSRAKESLCLFVGARMVR